ncbi:MAG TPA: FAD-dependent thymidylate synthase [Ktedonobacterales bacterium]
MRIITEPEIYIVGRQSIDHEAVSRFLADHDTEWITDSERGSELIVELAGRLCFDAETEVLTDQGWKHFANLDRSESVLTLNPVTHYVEYQTPIAYHEYDYVGDLKCVEGGDISFAVTPEHRQYGRFSNGVNGFVRTDEIGERQFRILSAGSGWIGAYPEAVILPGVASTQTIANQFGSYGAVAIAARPRTFTTTQQMRSLALLLTYYVTEGTLRNGAGAGQGIVIYGAHEEEVQRLCESLNLPVATYIDNRNNVARMHVGGGATIRHYCENECGTGSQNKRLPNWVLNLPADELALIWDTLVRTDGHHYSHCDRDVLITTSKILAGQAQEILCKLGYNSAVLFESNGVNHPVYRVSRKQGREIVLNKNARIEDRPYEGKVYCVTTDNGIIYVRRNGKPHFSGNCYMSFGSKQFRKTNEAYVGNLINQGHGSVLEHAVWDLVITGVSRSFTHELVRHRAGTGISQLSQRYVDESTADFVEPGIIAGDPALHELWSSAIQSAHESYKALVERLAEKVQAEHPDLGRTARMKMAREAARSVLPNATETKLMFSANARALRWIITLRGGEGAEPEIRRFAVKLGRIMREEAPTLFGDIEIVTLPDGSEGTRVGHQKV